MPDIIWTVTLGIAIDNDLDSDENPWYKETCDLYAPSDVKENELEKLAFDRIYSEMDTEDQRNLVHSWLEEYYPNDGETNGE